MHKTHTDAIQFAQKLHYALEERDYERQEICICAPFTDLRTLQTLFDADRMSFELGAQDVFWEQKGAFTGEISPVMLAALDIRYVIVGHSERRQFFGDTNEVVARKARAVVDQGMAAIVAVGENEDQREAGDAESTVARQLSESLDGCTDMTPEQLVVAYEPIWAIGTGRVASTDDAEEMCTLIRRELGGLLSPSVAAGVRVLYGGSVKSGNVENLMARDDIDGALVGGASLDPAEFARILTVW